MVFFPFLGHFCPCFRPVHILHHIRPIVNTPSITSPSEVIGRSNLFRLSFAAHTDVQPGRTLRISAFGRLFRPREREFLHLCSGPGGRRGAKPALTRYLDVYIPLPTRHGVGAGGYHDAGRAHRGARASPARFAAQWGVISYKVSLSELTFTLRMGSEARCNGLRRGTAARSAHDPPAAGAHRGAWGILGRAES